jgi:phospholipase/lecithinase/hemolysin
MAKKFKNDFVQTKGDLSQSTKLANCSENKSNLKQARQRLMAAGRQAFSFVTLTSSDHTISLWCQGTQVLLL